MSTLEFGSAYSAVTGEHVDMSAAREMTAEDILTSEFTWEFLGRYEDDYLAGCDEVRDSFIADVLWWDSFA